MRPRYDKCMLFISTVFIKRTYYFNRYVNRCQHVIILLMYTEHFSVKWSLTEEWVTGLTFVSSIPQSLRSCFLQCWTLHWLPPNHQPRMWDHPACKTITAVQQQFSVGEKSPSNQFDVTMGSFDGAETCELFGFNLLSLLKKYGQNIGLYQDDGLAAFNMKPCEMEKSKKRFDFTHREKWSKWMQRFDRFCSASGLRAWNEETHYPMGEKSEDIMTTFNLTAENAKKYNRVKEKIKTYFIKCQKNEFQVMFQTLGETVVYYRGTVHPAWDVFVCYVQDEERQSGCQSVLVRGVLLKKGKAKSHQLPPWNWSYL